MYEIFLVIEVFIKVFFVFFIQHWKKLLLLPNIYILFLNHFYLNRTSHIFLLLILTFTYSSVFSQKKRLTIFAKDSIENAVLQKTVYKKIRLDKIAIQSEMDSIKSKLHKLGYINLQKKTQQENDSLLQIEYKLNTPIKTIQIKINSKNKNLLQAIKEDYILNRSSVTLPFTQVSSFLNKITKHFESTGFSFNKVKLKTILFHDNHITADLIIETNPQRKMNRIVIQGYDDFSKKFVDRYLFPKKDNQFNKSNLKLISERTKTISFVSEVKKPQVLFLKDSTLIYIYLKKKKTNQLDGLIGFSSNNESDIIFNGHLNLALNNVFNQGEQLNLQWKSTANKNKELSIFANIPYIFNSKISPQSNFSIFSQDSSFVNIKSNTIIHYQINYKNKIGAVFLSSNSKKIRKLTSDSIKDFKSFFYGINYTYKKSTNNTFYTDKTFFQIELLQGNQKTDIDSYFKSKVNFEGSYLYSINKKNLIYLKNTSSFLLSDTYIDNELSRIGGPNTIRGFKDKSIPTSKFSSFTMDYNYLINNRTSIYSILDYTFAVNDYLNTKNSLYGVGIGYKTKLKSAIFNINYTIGLTNTQKTNTNDGILNIEFVTLF